MTRTLQITRALMTAGLLETLRRKDLYVVLILTLLLTLGASAFRAFGVQGLEIFVKDVALTAIGVMTTVLTVLIAARQIPEEMQRRTIYPLMARPITRGQLLLGKWATATMTASLCFMLLALTTLGLLLTLGIGVKPIFVQYVILKLLGIGWLCAMVLALSLYMTPAANVTLSLILAFGSGLFGRLLLMAHWEHDLSALWLNLLYGVLPHYDYFDMSKKVVFDWDLCAVVGAGRDGGLCRAEWRRVAAHRLAPLPQADDWVIASNARPPSATRLCSPRSDSPTRRSNCKRLAYTSGTPLTKSPKASNTGAGCAGAPTPFVAAKSPRQVQYWFTPPRCNRFAPYTIGTHSFPRRYLSPPRFGLWRSSSAATPKVGGRVSDTVSARATVLPIIVRPDWRRVLRVSLIVEPPIQNVSCVGRLYYSTGFRIGRGGGGF
jgi:ABC-type transport system involved in multi-copper enzyme maturation permease subunit